MQAFAGDNPNEAVFYPRDDTFLIHRELLVRLHEVYGGTPFAGLDAVEPEEPS